MKKIKWTRATVMAWIEDYSKATIEFNAMEKDEKIQIMEILRDTYPDGHSQLPAINAQIERIRKS